jgi:hypothetical protein
MQVADEDGLAARFAQCFEGLLNAQMPPNVILCVLRRSDLRMQIFVCEYLPLRQPMMSGYALAPITAKFHPMYLA